MPPITAVEMARHLNCAENTVFQRVRAGMPRHDVRAAKLWILDNPNISRTTKEEIRRSLELEPEPEVKVNGKTRNVVKWCEQSLTLGPWESEKNGPLRIRPYFREIMQTASNPRITECTLCAGVQLGKTVSVMGIASWVLGNEPAGMLWVMPNHNLGVSFSRSRWLPMINECESLKGLMPDDRYAISHSEQRFTECTLNFVGSNSPANLASRPVKWLICDETDKFADATEKEASAIELAKMRTRSFKRPKIILTSTPTVEDGEIWQHYLRGDRRRYKVTCPHCKALIAFVWDQVKFGEARKENGEWDRNEIRRIARYECQECGGIITDKDKARIIKNGIWVPENENAIPGVRSYHLNSLYSPQDQCCWAALALEWVDSVTSHRGLQGFVNSILAEPWEERGPESDRPVVVTDAPAPEGTTLMTVDCQGTSPFFWYVIRRWQNGDSVCLEATSAERWDDLREIQEKHGVKDYHVFIDSGYIPNVVFENCMRWGRPILRPMKPALWRGWMPTKGYDREITWTINGVQRAYRTVPMDPVSGKFVRRRGKTEIRRLDFNAFQMKDILERVRRGDGRRKWEVSRTASSDEYWKHLDSEIRVQRLNQRTGRTSWEWKKRSQRWPNHLFDCEVLQVAGSILHRLFEPKDETADDNGTGGSTETESTVR